MSVPTQPYKLSVNEALHLISEKKLSSQEWVTSCLERIDQRDPNVRAFVEINSHALEEVNKRQDLGLDPSIPVGYGAFCVLSSIWRILTCEHCCFEHLAQSAHGWKECFTPLPRTVYLV